jgi:hypothetical protein
MPRIQRLALSVTLAVVYLYSRPGLAQTDTSTAGIVFPEDSGTLPRAKMPEGGTEHQPNDQGGEHGHSHTHGGKEHSHTHSHEGGEGHEHTHGDDGHTHGDDGHTHGADGHTHAEHEPPHGHIHDHSHRHGTFDHTHPHEHGHTHDHSTTTGHAHDHLHDEDEDHEHSHTAEQEPKSKLRFSFDGYLKVIGEVVENDPLSTFIGRNDGFRVGNARIGFNAAYGDDLLAYISLESSVQRTEDFNQANAELDVGPRDLFLAYQLSRHAQITLGRFKAPYDVGELENEGDRTFIDVPLESRGVAPTQGFEIPGLRQGRQIGLMLSRQRLGLSDDGFDIGYAIALTNGRTETLALNDNDRPAGFARFSLYFTKWVALNVGGFTDTRTTGELPNLFEEEVKGLETSLILRLGDLRIEGQLLYQRTTFPTAQTPRVNSFGLHAQWSYRIWNLEAAYRFAYFDPNHRFDVDSVNEHTLGLSYYVSDVPLRFTINATLAQEQRGRELENNRLSALAQYNF